VHVCGTSGYAALNVAFLKRATHIALLGFDMYGGYWHRAYNHLGGPRISEMSDVWSAAFEPAARQLENAGVIVTNYSPDSRITAFPKATLEQLGQKEIIYEHC